MGWKYPEVSEEMKIVPCRSQLARTATRVQVEGKDYALPGISAMILQKLKADAERPSASPSRTPSSPSAYFNNAQREEATRTRGGSPA